MTQTISPDLLDHFFPASAGKTGIAPRGARLHAMPRPWSMQELHDAGEAAMMMLFETGQRQSLKPLMKHLDDRAWLESALSKDRQEFYEGRNGAPLSDLQIAVADGNSAQAAALLRAEAPESPALTSLHIAAFEGTSSMVDELIAAGAELDAVNALGDTPALIATAAGNCDALAALLRHGANANAVNKEGATPLMRAIAAMASTCVELLIPVSDLNARDNDGHRAIDYAPLFHADPDDPAYDEAVRFSRLLQSLQEADDLEVEVGAPQPKPARSL